MENSLLSKTGLPRFEELEPGQVVPAIRQLLDELRGEIRQLERLDEPTFDNLVMPLEDIQHRLSRAWSPVSHLHMVDHSEGWQKAFAEALPLVTEFSSELGQNRRLYDAYLRVANALPADASDEQRELINKALRDFRLAGVALDDERQARFRALVTKLSADQTRFSTNLQSATDAWSWHTEHAPDVAGLPDDVLSQAENAAREAGRRGWLFGLTQPVYQAVVNHAGSESTRRRFYEAWLTRASDTGPHDPRWDNSALIREILATRQEMADLLGFESYADYSLAPKMAGSIDEVRSFLAELAERSRDAAEDELAQLEALAGREIAAWDLAYFSELRKEKTFAISNDELRPYFPAKRVCDGLFELAERLYGIRFVERGTVQKWHPDVDYFDVIGRDDESIGGFYTDLYARPGKRGGAWIDECVVRKSLPNETALPVGYLVCNFSPANGDHPSLLNHTEVVTLFHEFGHMLHHLLTTVSYPSIAGINGVPWDAVELPSQFMENFAWHYEVLQRCSGHYVTGAPLPREMFERLRESRTAHAGLQMLRQVEFALFDFNLHADREAAKPGRLEAVLEATRDAVTLVKPPAWNRFENGFAHIFAGGYAAGYYSYKWAEVLAADAFSAFAEAGIFDADVARRFREHILEIGGSRDIMVAYVDFRGREPRLDALLETSGIAAA